MYVANGYVYASLPVADIRVQSARMAGDMIMLVTFSTGETRLLDGMELCSRPAFARLADPKLFSAFTIDHGVLTWCNGEIDIAPEGLYRATYEYEPASGPVSVAV